VDRRWPFTTPKISVGPRHTQSVAPCRVLDLRRADRLGTIPQMSAPPYSPVYRAGEWACVSGQLGITADGLPGTFAAQVRQVFVNLQALLEANDLRPDQIAKTTVFLTSMDDYADMNVAYLEYFGEHRPARSAIAVAALPFGGLVEIEAWVHTG